MEEREFALCRLCDSVVYREPGKRHGDGQQDTEESPVWLFWCDCDEYDGDLDKLHIVDCGCND